MWTPEIEIGGCLGGGVGNGCAGGGENGEWGGLGRGSRGGCGSVGGGASGAGGTAGMGDGGGRLHPTLLPHVRQPSASHCKIVSRLTIECERGRWRVQLCGKHTVHLLHQLEHDGGGGGLFAIFAPFSTAAAVRVLPGGGGGPGGESSGGAFQPTSCVLVAGSYRSAGACLGGPSCFAVFCWCLIHGGT